MATFLEKLSLNELSLVDKGANQHASVTIFKRAPETNENSSAIAKALIDNSAASFAEVYRDQMSDRELWPMIDALQQSVRSIITDEKLSAEERHSKAEASVNEFLTAVRNKLPASENEVAKSLLAIAGSSGSTTANDKENHMAKTVEELQKALDDMQVDLAKAEKLAKASDAVKEYMKGLSDEDKGKFMALSSEDQEKKAAAVKKSDETLELHGQTITKSAVGDSMFAIMKAQSVEIAKAREEVAKAREEAETERLAKRADGELAALPGDRVTKARILKASQTLSTEDKTAFDAMLKAANSSLAKAFTTVGKSTGGEVVEGSAEDKLQKKAEEIAKRDNISVAKAYSTAVSENPALYDEIEAARAGE